MPLSLSASEHDQLCRTADVALMVAPSMREPHVSGLMCSAEGDRHQMIHARVLLPDLSPTDMATATISGVDGRSVYGRDELRTDTGTAAMILLAALLGMCGTVTSTRGLAFLRMCGVVGCLGGAPLLGMCAPISGISRAQFIAMRGIVSGILCLQVFAVGSAVGCLIASPTQAPRVAGQVAASGSLDAHRELTPSGVTGRAVVAAPSLHFSTERTA